MDRIIYLGDLVAKVADYKYFSFVADADKSNILLWGTKKQNDKDVSDLIYTFPEHKITSIIIDSGVVPNTTLSSKFIFECSFGPDTHYKGNVIKKYAKLEDVDSIGIRITKSGIIFFILINNEMSMYYIYNAYVNLSNLHMRNSRKIIDERINNNIDHDIFGFGNIKDIEDRDDAFILISKVENKLFYHWNRPSLYSNNGLKDEEKFLVVHQIKYTKDIPQKDNGRDILVRLKDVAKYISLKRYVNGNITINDIGSVHGYNKLKIDSLYSLYNICGFMNDMANHKFIKYIDIEENEVIISCYSESDGYNYNYALPKKKLLHYIEMEPKAPILFTITHSSRDYSGIATGDLKLNDIRDYSIYQKGTDCIIVLNVKDGTTDNIICTAIPIFNMRRISSSINLNKERK